MAVCSKLGRKQEVSVTRIEQKNVAIHNMSRIPQSTEVESIHRNDYHSSSTRRKEDIQWFHVCRCHKVIVSSTLNQQLCSCHAQEVWPVFLRVGIRGLGNCDVRLESFTWSLHLPHLEATALQVKIALHGKLRNTCASETRMHYNNPFSDSQFYEFILNKDNSTSSKCNVTVLSVTSTVLGGSQHLRGSRPPSSSVSRL